MRRSFISIELKIVSIILVILAASISLSLFFSVRLARDNLLGNMRQNLTIDNDIFSSTIRSLMLSGEAPVAVKTLDSLKSIEGLKSIALYRADGSSAFSDYTTLEFVNSYQSDHVFERTPRMARAVMANSDFRSVLESNTPRQVESVADRTMKFYSPILNFSQCRECHGESPFIRGVAVYEVSTAGAYDRINRTGVYIALVLAGMGGAIALLLIALMSRIVVSPILAIEGVVSRVGEGDLEVKVDLHTRDELGRLGERINGMIEGLKVRNRLAIENRTIEARNQENRKYLDNIGQGLLLLGKDLRIREQYSVFLVKLFGVENPTGMAFLDLVYPDPALVEERAELERFLNFVFYNTVTDMEMINSVNPLRERRLSVPTSAGGRREIVFDASFVRIPEGDEIGSVMAIFEDLTGLVRAKEELADQRELRDAELEEIAAILRAGPAAFADFVHESLRALERVRSSLPNLEDPEVAGALFRDVHSLKGSARYFELKRLARHAH